MHISRAQAKTALTVLRRFGLSVTLSQGVVVYDVPYAHGGTYVDTPSVGCPSPFTRDGHARVATAPLRVINFCRRYTSRRPLPAKQQLARRPRTLADVDEIVAHTGLPAADAHAAFALLARAGIHGFLIDGPAPGSIPGSFSTHIHITHPRAPLAPCTPAAVPPTDFTVALTEFHGEASLAQVRKFATFKALLYNITTHARADARIFRLHTNGLPYQTVAALLACIYRPGTLDTDPIAASKHLAAVCSARNAAVFGDGEELSLIDTVVYDTAISEFMRVFRPHLPKPDSFVPRQPFEALTSDKPMDAHIFFSMPSA